MNGALFDWMKPPFRHPEWMGRIIVAQSILLPIGVAVLVWLWGEGDWFVRALLLVTLINAVIWLVRYIVFWRQYRAVEVPLRPVRFRWWD
jgi:hypothetical protein